MHIMPCKLCPRRQTSNISCISRYALTQTVLSQPAVLHFAGEYFFMTGNLYRMAASRVRIDIKAGQVASARPDCMSARALGYWRTRADLS